MEAFQGVFEIRSRTGGLHIAGVAAGTSTRGDARLPNGLAEFQRGRRNGGAGRRWRRRRWQGQTGSFPLELPPGFAPDPGTPGLAGGPGFGSPGPLLCDDVEQAELADHLLHRQIGLQRIGQASGGEPPGGFPDSRGAGSGPRSASRGRGRSGRSGGWFIGKHRPQNPPESAEVRAPRALRLEAGGRYPQYRTGRPKLDGAAAYGAMGLAGLVESAKGSGDVIGVAQREGQRKGPTLQPFGKRLAFTQPLFGLRYHN
jgi:hypothetical protein